MSRLVRCHECEYWDVDREFDGASWEAPDRAEVKFGLCRGETPKSSVLASDKVVDLHEVNRLVRYLPMPEPLRLALKAWWDDHRQTLPAVPRKFMRGSWFATHRMDGCAEGRRIVPEGNHP